MALGESTGMNQLAESLDEPVGIANDGSAPVSSDRPSPPTLPKPESERGEQVASTVVESRREGVPDWVHSAEQAGASGESSRPATMPMLPLDVEERLRRLEEAVALLQDTKRIEEQVLSRIEQKRPAAPVAQVAQAPVARVAQAPVAAVAGPPRPLSGELAMAGRVLLPAAVGAVRAQSELAQAAPSVSAKPPWLIFEMAAELRAMFWMFFDRRYQVQWFTWLAPILAIVLAFNAWFFLGGTALFGFGHLLEKLIDLPIAYTTYKVLQRESLRYRQAFPPGGATATLPPA
jgi:hypothetical protein